MDCPIVRFGLKKQRIEPIVRVSTGFQSFSHHSAFLNRLNGQTLINETTMPFDTQKEDAFEELNYSSESSSLSTSAPASSSPASSTPVLRSTNTSSGNEYQDVSANEGETSQQANDADQQQTERKTSQQAADSTNQQATDKPIWQASEVICELGWAVRDAIILHLNRHSALLVGKSISAQAKKEMMEKNVHLLSVLINLPMKGGDQTERKALVDQSSLAVEEDDDGSNRVILELAWDAKTRLINGLNENHHFAILYNSSVSDEAKLNLVAQNKKLLRMLMNLPFRVETPSRLLFWHFLCVFGTDPSLHSSCLIRTDQRELLLWELLCNSQNERKIIVWFSLSNTGASECTEREESIDLATRFHLNLSDHQVAKECLHVDTAEKIFVIKFDRIAEFLASNAEAKEQRSKLLRCDDIIWYLKLSKTCQDCAMEAHQSTETDLSVKLIAIVGSDVSSIDAYFNIKLCDQSTVRYEVVERSVTRTFTRSKFWWGWSSFTPTKHLNELEFIKDDSIKMQLHLKVLNIERVEY